MPVANRWGGVDKKTFSVESDAIEDKPYGKCDGTKMSGKAKKQEWRVRKWKSTTENQLSLFDWESRMDPL